MGGRSFNITISALVDTVQYSVNNCVQNSLHYTVHYIVQYSVHYKCTRGRKESASRKFGQISQQLWCLCRVQCKVQCTVQCTV